MSRKMTEEQKMAWAAKMKAAREAKQTQTKTTNTNDTTKENTITLTQKQFDTLIRRLDAGNVTDRAQAPSMTPGIGMSSPLQVNPFGQVIGTVTKFNVDPNFYPDPIEELYVYCDTNPRMKRHNVRDNYFITFDITAKPYQTKDHQSIQEPTFHLTLYGNEFNDEGEPTGRAMVIQ